MIDKIKNKLRRIYLDNIRSVFPNSDKKVTYNNVQVRPYKSIDRVVNIQLPPNQGGHPSPSEYEKGLITSIKKYVEKGEKAILIGGGIGVSTVVCSRKLGNEGNVIVYEGAYNMVNIIRNTININKTPSNIKIEHAVVGKAVRLDGYRGRGRVVNPGALSYCDTLIMDCEGAEVNILESIDFTPRKIIVETHGNKSEVILRLNKLGHSVNNVELAEGEPLVETCRENEIFVVYSSIE